MAVTKNPIAAALSSFKRPELDDINVFIGARVPSSMKKADFVNSLSAFIVSKPKKWLSRMLERDLRLLKELIGLGKGAVLYADYPDYPSVLETIKLIDVDSSDDNFRKLSVSPEVYDIVAPCIDSVIARNESSGRFRMERLAFGILNLYGVLEFADFEQIMWSHYSMIDLGIEYDKFLALLYDMPILKVTVYYEKGRCFISSPCAPRPEDLYDELTREYQDVESYKDFSLDEVMEAGSDAPYFVFGMNTPEGQEVRSMLQSLGYSGEDIRREMHDIWINSQSVFDDASTEALLSCVNRKMDDIPSFEKYSQYIQMVASYANSLPKWLIKGWNSNEENLLKVVLKVDDPSEDEQPEDEAYQDFRLPEPTVSEGYESQSHHDILDGLFSMIPHVAKDDPCPCGSGLRYRNCHGKYLS